MTPAVLIAAVALAAWLFLACGRGGFWLCAQRDAPTAAAPGAWPDVVAIVPARDEAAGIEASLGSLLRQSYPGRFSVILVDDQSTDGTSECARRAAANSAALDRLVVATGAPPPAGWTGKLWALHQGVMLAQGLEPPPAYLLFCDADIGFEGVDVVARLVARACAEGLVLNSLMVRLRCVSLPERMLIPAFVFFFQMLYPFARVNRPGDATAAAAGGCVLLDHAALQATGGVAAIRGALIDDCALGAQLKQAGRIRLALARDVHSLREYPAFRDMGAMIARCAFAQLRYSHLILAASMLGMALVYLAPPVLAIAGDGAAQFIALWAWGLMSALFTPTLLYHRVGLYWAPLLPLIALLYMAFTLLSAYQDAGGRGGMWKGRAQAIRSGKT